MLTLPTTKKTTDFKSQVLWFSMQLKKLGLEFQERSSVSSKISLFTIQIKILQKLEQKWRQTTKLALTWRN